MVMSIIQDDSLVFDKGEGGVGCAECFEGLRNEVIDCSVGEVVFC